MRNDDEPQFPQQGSSIPLEIESKLLKGLEARVGIEPTHKGFADLSLTTWVPRLGRAAVLGLAPDHRSQPGWRRRADWSGRRDLNSRPSPWQGDALPLSYSRLRKFEYTGRVKGGQTGSFIQERVFGSSRNRSRR